MKKLNTILSGAALLATLAFFLPGCTSTTSPSGTAVPTNVSATTASSSSIMVTWTRDASDAAIDTVFVMNGAAVAGQAVVASPGVSATITGLSAGVTYSITVHSSGGVSAAISWAIAGSPSALMALSKDGSSIALKWTRGAGDNMPDTIITTGGSVAPLVVTSASNVTVTGLASRVQYTFTVHAASGTSNSVTWMTATRTMGLKLYQYSVNGLSGLVLNGSGGSAEVVTAGVNAPPGLDFALNDNVHDATITGPSGLSFDAADFILSSGGRANSIDKPDHYVVGGLDADYSSTSYSTVAATLVSGGGVSSYPIPDNAGYNTTGSRVLLVGTVDGNFAKIEIVPDAATGKLYSVDGVGKYITVNVSYQPDPGQPYAARAHRAPVARTVRTNAR